MPRHHHEGKRKRKNQGEQARWGVEDKGPFCEASVVLIGAERKAGILKCPQKGDWEHEQIWRRDTRVKEQRHMESVPLQDSSAFRCVEGGDRIVTVEIQKES